MTFCKSTFLLMVFPQQSGKCLHSSLEFGYIPELCAQFVSFYTHLTWNYCAPLPPYFQLKQLSSHSKEKVILQTPLAVIYLFQFLAFHWHPAHHMLIYIHAHGIQNQVTRKCKWWWQFKNKICKNHFIVLYRENTFCVAWCGINVLLLP